MQRCTNLTNSTFINSQTTIHTSDHRTKENTNIRKINTNKTTKLHSLDADFRQLETKIKS